MDWSATTESAARPHSLCAGVTRVARRWWFRIAPGAGRPLAGRHSAGMPPGDHTGGPARSDADRALAAQRADAMRRLFPKLAAWQAPPSFTARLSAAYEDLAQAADATDLARRIRKLETAH